MKRILTTILLLALSIGAQAQFVPFVPNQILTAQQLNYAFSQFLPLSGGTLTGPLTLSSIINTPISGSSGNFTTLSATGLATFTGSVNFTGTTTAVTQPTLDNTTKVSTDAFVTNDLVRAKANQPVLATGGVYNLQSHGTGLQVVGFAPSGQVSSILAIAVPGTGYAVGDILRLAGGNIDATVRVNTIGAGGSVPIPADLTVTSPGTSYVTGVQVVTLEPPVNSYNTITYIGAMTSNMTVILPAGTFIAQSRLEEINNNSTGAFTITYFLSNGSGGTIGNGIVIPQGTNNSCATWIQTDGVTDVWYASPPVCAISIASHTVSTLPATGPKGSRAYVTDATTCTFLGALTGSGATFCPVIYNGSAWVGG